jgi:predicted MPP superfamily phosphohydrolase
MRGLTELRTFESLKILHISDLHFGWDGDAKDRDERKIALNGIPRVLNALDADWKPNCVCITGDIGWRGSSGDYAEAASWINELLGTLGIGIEALLLCPGNHDLDRNVAAQNIRPHDSREADRVLGKIPVPRQYQEPFDEFAAFCKTLNLPALQLGDIHNYLIGVRHYRGVSFISLNTAWFSQDNYDEGKLWLGLPLLRHLEAKGQLLHPSKLHEGQVCIALLHHPKESLNEAEQRAADYGRPNTFDFLARRCHLILTGHKHGEVRKADRVAEAAWHLSGGATYGGGGYLNTFRIVRVERDRFIYRSFEYDPRSADNLWHPKDQATELSFFLQKSSTTSHQSKTSTSLLGVYRNDSLLAAEKLIQGKSRALKPEGLLPRTLPLSLSLSLKGHRYFFTNFGRLVTQPNSQVRVEPSIGIKQSRRSLILGDLGSGKSTLAATLVIQILRENQKALALIIPATGLEINQHLKVKDLLRALSVYFSEQISPATEAIDIESLLKESVEVTIVIDGLDEISRPQAAILLSRLGEAVDHWATVQVIATGRPVELQGISYEDWNVLSVAPLNEEEKIRFFESEARAEGHGENEAKEIARQLADNLRRQPRLNSLASTPLIVRLLYSKLFTSDAEHSQTLGDILYDLVQERLGAWSIKDKKATPKTTFETEFPDAFSRAALLGRFALAFEGREGMPLEESRVRLQELIKHYVSGNLLVLSNEALEFFVKSGLISISNQVQFSFQPLFEAVSGIGLVDLWRSDPAAYPEMTLARWRIVSFFVAGLRRLNLVKAAGPAVTSFVKKLLADEHGVPAAAYITSESQDASIAEVFIECLKGLGHNPITFFQEERIQSARAIAESIRLANMVGFDWFYNRYLDPRYPTIRYGSMGTDEVFRQWTLLSDGKLSEHEKSRLSLVVRPHIQAGSYQLISVLPLLAVLLPEAFSVEERLWFCGSLLERGEISGRAKNILKEAFNEGHKDVVNQILLRHAQRGYENSATAAHLWLKLNKGQPPAIVIHTLIRYFGHYNHYPEIFNAIEDVVSRVGRSTWKAFLLFYLFDEDHYLSAGAAIGLYHLGEQRLSLLSTPLLGGIHDGNSSRQAEETLDKLIPTGNPRVLSWLAERIAAEYNDSMEHGAPTGWWRLLLSRLPSIENEGPDLLAHSVGGTGCFLFPRYPEIRQLFRDLLTGPHGKAYLKALREKLYDLHPEMRHGAAMTLAVCDPDNEGQAVETIVKYDSRRGGTWYEWKQYCLSLSFGPSVLTHLQSKLPTLAPMVRVFALAILFRNGITLEDSHHDELARGLCDIRNYGLDAEDPQLSFLSSSVAFDSLWQIVEDNTPEKSERAAEYLIRYHSQRLSLYQRAKCAVLAHASNSYRFSFLRDQIKELQSDQLYASEVEKVSLEITTKGGKRPILDLLRKALADRLMWGEFIWEIICDDSTHKSDNELQGQFLLDIGRDDIKVGESIGKACTQFLEDPRVSASSGDAKQWLAILADEFVGLPIDKLEAALRSDIYGHYSTTSALLARIGYLPTGYQVRDAVGSVPKLSTDSEPQAARSELIKKLQDLTRESGHVHPELCSTLEALLFKSPLSDKEMDSITANGKQGTLAVTVLSFVLEQPPELRNYVRLFPFWLPSSEKDPCFNRLRNLCRHGNRTLIEDEAVRSQYLELLDNAMETGSGDTFFTAAELLAIRGTLNISQAGLVFSTYATDRSPFDHGLGNELVKWISSDLMSDEALSLAEEVKRGIDVLDNHSWDKDELGDTFRFIFFPLAYWRLSSKSDDLSTRVFLRGVKFMFSRRSDNDRVDKPDEIIQRVGPLLSKVPKSILNETIKIGGQLDDPVVRGFCRLFLITSQE